MFDLELIDKASRDMFVQRLHRFLLINRKVSQSEADYLHRQDADVDGPPGDDHGKLTV